MFIINLEYKVELDVVDKYMPSHRSWLDGLFNAKQLLCSGPKIPRTGGIMISPLKNLSEIEELIKQDPYYINGVANYSITEFVLNKYQPALANLA